MEEDKKEKDSYKAQVSELKQHVEKLKAQAKDAIEQKAMSRFAQMSQDAAKELRKLRDNNKTMTAKIEMLTTQAGEMQAENAMLSAQVRMAEEEKVNLSKQNNMLLVSKNPQAKT